MASVATNNARVVFGQRVKASPSLATCQRSILLVVGSNSSLPLGEHNSALWERRGFDGRMTPAHRCRLRFLLHFSFVLVVLAFGASVGSSAALNLPSPFLGIAPQDEGYFAADVIACRDGSKSFRRDRLNDGFCDCLDGTDEPGTSACPEGRFYCRNIGDTPIILFSSRVNDHICDCCDGSDEYDGCINCQNTCSKDSDLLKGNTTSDSEERKLSQVNAGENKKRVDLEDLILRLKELRIAVFVQLLIAACVIASYLFHRHARSRRRRRWYMN